MIFTKLKTKFSSFRFNPTQIFLSFSVVSILMLGMGRVAEAQKNPTQVMDASSLKPPAGARVAIVEFYDLECPACAYANPTLTAAAEKYKIPLVRHDFLIPNHIWSPTAALNARWFDTKSKALGDEYRDQVFANQRSIYNQDALRDFTNKFARSQGVAMPFSLDPMGTLAAALSKDKEIGTRLGINSTPTIFVVIANSKGAPYLEVLNASKDLYTTIDQAFAMAGPATAAVPAKKTVAVKKGPATAAVPAKKTVAVKKGPAPAAASVK